MFMHYIKIFAKNGKELQTNIETIKIYSQHIQGLDKIMETRENFKQIYFISFSDCSPPGKFGLR